MIHEWTLQARVEAIRAYEDNPVSASASSWNLSPFNRIVVRDGLGWDGLIAQRAVPTNPQTGQAWARIILRTSRTPR